MMNDLKHEVLPEPINSFYVIVHNGSGKYVTDKRGHTTDITKAVCHSKRDLVSWWAFECLGDWIAVWSLVRVFECDKAYWCDSDKKQGDRDTVTIVVDDKLLVCRRMKTTGRFRSRKPVTYLSYA